MSTVIDRQPGESPLLLQEGKEAVRCAQNVVDRGWGETVVVGRIEPRIDIVQGGMREVSIDPGLACHRQEHAEGFDDADGGLDRRRSIMACP